MRRPLATLGLAALAAVVAFPAFAGAIETTILGRDPGEADGYSCFRRTYDAAHLASHPRQNVNRMLLLMTSTFNTDSGREDMVEIGIGFRPLKQWFQISGNCSTTVDGAKVLNCGADCDGGSFNVSSKGADAVLVAIPDYVSIWDPAASDDDPPGDLPKGAALKADDHQFKLDRVDVRECQALMTDEARVAVFGVARRDE